jgi:hypothetical protein
VALCHLVKCPYPFGNVHFTYMPFLYVHIATRNYLQGVRFCTPFWSICVSPHFVVIYLFNNCVNHIHNLFCLINVLLLNFIDATCCTGLACGHCDHYVVCITYSYAGPIFVMWPFHYLFGLLWFVWSWKWSFQDCLIQAYNCWKSCFTEHFICERIVNHDFIFYACEMVFWLNWHISFLVSYFIKISWKILIDYNTKI